MQYRSTRGLAGAVSPARAVLSGMAPDGGLYLPEKLPPFDWQACVRGDFYSQAARLLEAFFPDIPHMQALADSAYRGKFSAEQVTPTVRVGDFTVLELFRGPTSAFKDVALSMLPRLMAAARDALGETKEILILTATSGDTGKAALEGFRDVPGISICVFYPHGGVSDIQRLQMVTQPGENVAVAAIRGNFDDAQTGVKEIFRTFRERELPVQLSSANSINIGRLVPQITYYFSAYRDLVESGSISMGEAVNFSVPTGNFGDILAGFLARQLGLPVGRLICASNANDVLTEFLETGVYRKTRPFHKTLSPSMDILVSSNLERLLYLKSGDPAFVADCMERLSRQGQYTVPGPLLEDIRQDFWGCAQADADGKNTIRRVWQEEQYLIDPHTATAWAAAEQYRAKTGDSRPTVVLATASPYKFPEAVLSALGEQTRGDAFRQMARISGLTGTPVPENLAGLDRLPQRHTAVIDKEKMGAFALKKERE